MKRTNGFDFYQKRDGKFINFPGQTNPNIPGIFSRIEFNFVRVFQTETRRVL